MREILLSKSGKNKGKYVAFVDDEDFDMVNKYRWSFSGGYASSIINHVGLKKRTLLHRFVLSIINVEVYVDHIDHNGLNCQKNNLRECTLSQNQGNRKGNKLGTSEFKGVSINTQKNKYVSVIRASNKRIFLGYFNIETDAAIAYDKKALQLFGEFAYLNFPDMIEK